MAEAKGVLVESPAHEKPILPYFLAETQSIIIHVFGAKILAQARELERANPMHFSKLLWTGKGARENERCGSSSFSHLRLP